MSSASAEVFGNVRYFVLTSIRIKMMHTMMELPRTNHTHTPHHTTHTYTHHTHTHTNESEGELASLADVFRSFSCLFKRNNFHEAQCTLLSKSEKSITRPDTYCIYIGAFLLLNSLKIACMNQHCLSCLSLCAQEGDRSAARRNSETSLAAPDITNVSPPAGKAFTKLTSRVKKKIVKKKKIFSKDKKMSSVESRVLSRVYCLESNTSGVRITVRVHEQVYAAPTGLTGAALDSSCLR